MIDCYTPAQQNCKRETETSTYNELINATQYNGWRKGYNCRLVKLSLRTDFYRLLIQQCKSKWCRVDDECKLISHNPELFFCEYNSKFMKSHLRINWRVGTPQCYCCSICVKNNKKRRTQRKKDFSSNYYSVHVCHYLYYLFFLTFWIFKKNKIKRAMAHFHYFIFLFLNIYFIRGVLYLWQAYASYQSCMGI